MTSWLSLCRKTCQECPAGHHDAAFRSRTSSLGSDATMSCVHLLLLREAHGKGQWLRAVLCPHWGPAPRILENGWSGSGEFCWLSLRWSVVGWSLHTEPCGAELSGLPTSCVSLSFSWGSHRAEEPRLSEAVCALLSCASLLCPGSHTAWDRRWLMSRQICFRSS